MKTWLITGIATAALLGLGGYLIHGFGDAKFKAGQSDAIADNAVAVITINETNAKELERILNETQNMSDSDIDADLRRLGIMREYSDR